ncbi:MAG TPA: esterase family protein [Candidatus Pullichristensenella excrementipullorum]|nr:esterase family protein [Candidatus Pullichristensenella excrementipullorum]
MAHLVVDYYADALGVQTRMHVLLPQRLAAGKAKTLYLLHGMSDDEGTWMRRTSIERYAEEKGLAVVMPDGGLGWYTDMYRGLAWFKFISGELPALCRRFFPILSDKREDTYIGGNSMGGYGALKCALRAPQTFSKVISLSGALDAADTAINNTVPATRRYWEDVFGPAEDVSGSENDLFAAATALTDPALRPRIYMWCGTEDFLYAQNIRMRDHLRALGYDLTYEESPGDHQWRHWDKKIADALNWLLPGEGEDAWR